MFRGVFFFSICYYFIKKVFFPVKWKQIEPSSYYPMEKNETVILPEEEWGQFIDIEIY